MIDVSEKKGKSSPMSGAAAAAFVWGSGDRGSLGTGDWEALVGLDGPPRSLQARWTGNVVSVSCGASHTALVTDLRQVWTWGANGDGQLGLSHTRDIAVPELVKVTLPDVACGAGSSLPLCKVACGARHTVF